MKLWLWLALCAWLPSCGLGSGPPGAVSPGPSPCGEPEDGTGFAHTLLRVACDGMLHPGRATWTVSDGAVTLDFAPGSPGPRGAELVTMWPPLNLPPWLGHRVRRFVVLPGGSIRVEFGEPAADPARLFADPRLAGVVVVVRDDDTRDAIDADEPEIVTRHDASIEYARALGRKVRLQAFDRLYLVAFARGGGAAGESALAADVGRDWVGMGAVGARRLPMLDWGEVGAKCAAAVSEVGGEAAGSSAGPAAPRRLTVSYREGDIAARQIAERLVSAGLRTGPPAVVIEELTGSRERMVVRPVVTTGGSWTDTDVAAVIGVRAGPVHPCSLYAEALRELAGWRDGPGRGGGAVLPIGEAAAFAVEPGTGA